MKSYLLPCSTKLKENDLKSIHFNCFKIEVYGIRFMLWKFSYFPFISNSLVLKKKLFVCKALCKTKLYYSQTAEHFFKMQFFEVIWVTQMMSMKPFIKTVRFMAPESGVQAWGGQSGHIVKYIKSYKIFYPTPVFIWEKLTAWSRIQ